MQYVTAENITTIHDRIIEATGGSFGIRENELLQSIILKPQAAFGGQDLYPSLYAKAAAVYEAHCDYRVFVGGNKCTAALTLYRFLNINDYDLTSTNKELEQYTLKVAMSQPDLADVAAWIKHHSKKC